MKKERIGGFDFIRAVCALGILCYHFYCHTASGFKPLHTFADGATFGTVFVTVFFMVSGAMLYYNHEEIGLRDLRSFYYSRWKRMFPLYWLVWGFFALELVFDNRVLFWAGSPWKIGLSLAGMDGYLNYLTAPNYYIVGEWFFGAIILMYALYPLLAAVFRRCPWGTFAVLGVLFLVIVKVDWFRIADPFHPVTCLFRFAAGMMVIRYREVLLEKRMTWIISLIVFLSMLVFGKYLDYRIVDMIAGFSLFFLLYFAGKTLEKQRIVGKCAAEIGGKLSFPLFLVHHVIINKVLGVRNPSGIKASTCMLLISIILSIVFAGAFYVIDRAVRSSGLFRKADRFFLKKTGASGETESK